MKLEEMTWQEVETYLAGKHAVILPTGSIEQHGPLGLIGTDTICAREIAWAAAEICEAIVAPEIAYAHAPFNMGFPGTVSISKDLYQALIAEVMTSLTHHGFEKIYVLNGHGANTEMLSKAAEDVDASVLIRAWWEFEPVNTLRQRLYGDWEGMHATPSEVAITQATHRVINDETLPAPRKLTPDYIVAHAGDRHGPPDQHRREFPDGRVGSHSGLARPEHGRQLLALAAECLAEEFTEFAG